MTATSDHQQKIQYSQAALCSVQVTCTRKKTVQETGTYYRGITINWYLSIVNMTYENIILLIGWFQFGTVYLIMW